MFSRQNERALRAVAGTGIPAVLGLAVPPFGRGMGLGAVIGPEAGTVAGALLICLVLAVLWWRERRRRVGLEAAMHTARETEGSLSQLLARSACILWQAEVAERDNDFDWKFEVPASHLQRRIFGGETGFTRNHLYDDLDVPELPEMRMRSIAALRSGAPGYEQEFHLVKPERTYWLQERVSIVPHGPGRWRLFGMLIDISVLKEAERIIRSSEERYRDLFESAVEGAYQAMPDGRFVSVNPALARIFGCATPAEFLAWTQEGVMALYVKPSRREEFFAELGARDSVAGFESEVRRRDGATIWITENVRAVRDSEGRLRYLQGFVSDVTERRRTLEAMQNSEARYRALFDNIPVAIMEVDLHEVGRRLQALHAAGVQNLPAHLGGHPEELSALVEAMSVTAVNDTAVDIYRATSKEHFRREVGRLFFTDILQMLRTFLEAIWQGRNHGEMEVEMQDCEGARRHTYLRWWAPRPEDGLQLEHAVVALVDLTDLKHTEDALAAEKERLAVTLTAMSEGVITTDTDGIVQFMNRAAEDLTRTPAAAASGRPLAESCTFQEEGTGRERILPIIRVLAEGVQVNLPAQTMLVGRDGAACLIEGCCAPVRAANGELVGTVLVLHDVTVRQRLEEELQRASRLESIGILAGGIAHDFNNILTAILGNVSLAQLDAGEPEMLERYLHEAERATLRARDLTQQLLTFAKGGEPIRTAVPLPEIIMEVAQFALHGSNVRCEFDLEEGLWLADADRNQLGQVVQNCVTNAVQAMPEGGTIRIGAYNEIVSGDSSRPLPAGDYVHIFMTDSGKGIPPEHLTKIFDPYFTTKKQGSGLGLATVYSIIRKHKGLVEVESEVGRGTTFHFWLPALHERQLDLPEEPPEGEAPLKGRVLFMDDETAILRVAEHLLRQLGFEVELAADGGEAVQKYEAAQADGRPFDLVIMDLTVPGGMGGREALEHLRRINPSVKAVVSSGYSSDPVLANYRAYGFRGMMAKPYKMDDFVRVLREVVRESRSPLPMTLRSELVAGSKD